jgi:pimeloyl-ACP methyl ester carboxylesterase
MDQQRLTIHGKSLKYRLGGKGPLVLLIHGMAGSAATWRQIMPALSERFTVLAPDLLGAMVNPTRQKGTTRLEPSRQRCAI